MNPSYSNDPQRIGNYYSSNDLLVTSSNRLSVLTPFDENSFQLPCETNCVKSNTDIMSVKPRSSVPEQFMSVGTKISKSCNLPGVSINRFENPHNDTQNPVHIITDEQFRGGIPSRIVTKDEYVSKNNGIYRK